MTLRLVPHAEYAKAVEDAIGVCKQLQGDYGARETRDGACMAFAMIETIRRIRELSPRRGP